MIYSKSDIINHIAEVTEVSKKDATVMVSEVFAFVQDTLAKGDSVRITGFGTFEARQRAARTGRNPQTGEALEIPATTVPAFRAGKTLKEAVK